MLVYTEQVWRALYRLGRPQVHVAGEPVVDPVPPLTYGRDYEFFQDFDPQTLEPVRGPTSRRAANRRAALGGLGALGNFRVFCIGSAFGFLMEELIDAGVTDTWGIEPSPYVWANTGEIRPDVLDRMVDATVGVTPVADIQGMFSALGMSNPLRAAWIIDEDAITGCESDVEIIGFLDACESLLQGGQHARIVHIITPIDVAKGPGDSSINWKTMTEWEAFRPTHTWVDARSLL